MELYFLFQIYKKNNFKSWRGEKIFYNYIFFIDKFFCGGGIKNLQLKSKVVVMRLVYEFGEKWNLDFSLNLVIIW